MLSIVEAFPKMLCIVLGLLQVVANLKEYENLKYVGWDMFEVIPPADALLLMVCLFLKNILVNYIREILMGCMRKI